MLEFDAETTRFLEHCYQGSDFYRRRRASFDALQLRPGDRVIDIGCGNGMLTVELARAVGDTGRVFGVDPSDDMRKLAQARSAEFDNVAFFQGTASAMPLGDGSCDKAVSIQVFEYLDDLPSALNEVGRVLQSGGLLVVGDMHFDTFVCFTEHRDRLARMKEAWNRHLVDHRVSETLPGILDQAGYTLESLRPVTFTDTVLRPDGIAQMMLLLMRQYALQNDLLPAAEVAGFFDEQQTLARDKRFFFSITHFVITARKH
jgi:ubiquinone/menaquinone biosynthesis C-methylase UbiE